MSSGLDWRVAVRCARTLLLCVALLMCRRSMAQSPLTNLLAEGAQHEIQGETEAALKVYLEAGRLTPHNPQVLIDLARVYCESMHSASNQAGMKAFAEKALACGLEALKLAPLSAESHVCVAICYAKQFPYSDNQTKVNYSRLIKAEAEKCVELDPKYDLGYHMLGRWNYEVSSMNFFVKGLVRIAYGGLPKASREAAVEYFKKAIELNPHRVIHHLQLARMYHVTGREKLVAGELQRCAELTPVDKDDRDAQDIARKIAKDGHWPEEF